MPNTSDGGDGTTTTGSSGRTILFTRNRSTKFKKPTKSKLKLKSKLKSKSTRFHGAFTGGFSAGYNHSVGSKEGWVPSSSFTTTIEEDDGVANHTNDVVVPNHQRSHKRKPPQQRIEDFMDDQDEEDWGGPTAVGSEYVGGTTIRGGRKKPKSDLDDDMEGNQYGNTMSIVPYSSNSSKFKFKSTSFESESSDNDNDGSGTGFLAKHLIPQTTNINTNQSLLGGSNNNLHGDTIGKRLLRSLGWVDRVFTTNTNIKTTTKIKTKETNKNEHEYENDGEGSAMDTATYAYVPLHEQNDDTTTPTTTTTNHNTPNNNLLQSNLISRKLRRIALRRHTTTLPLEQIPNPKTNRYGLGYEPFRNAPEFAVYHTERRKRAERRVRAATEVDGRKRRNVYRMDDLYGGGGGSGEEEEEEENRTKRGRGGVGDGNRGPLAPETQEDFIGTKTTGGFALQDDDDDVYDDHNEGGGGNRDMGGGLSLWHKGRVAGRGIVVVDGDGSGGGGGATEAIRKSGRYCDVAYETDESSDDDADVATGSGTGIGTGTTTNGSNTRKANGFAAVLGAWADNGVDTTTAPTVTKTFDGRLPLSGFHLNHHHNHHNNSNNNTSPKRYPGPDVPLSYQITRHVFREGDGTLKIGELSAVLARVQRNDRRDGVVGRGGRTGPLTTTTTTTTTTLNKTNNSAAFQRLSDALKQRFARSGETVGGGSSGGKTSSMKVEYDLTSKRTRMAWRPSPLLLKRFRVGAVTGSRGGTVDRAGAGAGVGGATGSTKKTGGEAEEVFFRNLSSSLGVVTNDERSGGGSSTTNVENGFVPLRPGNDYGDATGSDIDGIGGTELTSRPTTETMRAIFEPESEDDEMDISSSSSEEEKEDGTKQSDVDAAAAAMVESILCDGAAAAASAVGRGVVTPMSYPSSSLSNDVAADGKVGDKRGNDDDKRKSTDVPTPTKQVVVTGGKDQRDGTPIKENKGGTVPNTNNGNESRRYRSRRSTDSTSSSSSSSSDDGTSKRSHRRRRHRRPTKDHKKDKTRDRRRRMGSRDNTNDDDSNNINDDGERQRRRQRRTTKDRKKDRRRNDRPNK